MPEMWKQKRLKSEFNNIKQRHLCKKLMLLQGESAQLPRTHQDGSNTAASKRKWFQEVERIFKISHISVTS